MIKRLFLSFFIICTVAVKAQNLVPNGSFEDTVSCPTSRDISFVQNWLSFGGSPDYYNACATPGFVSVPSNLYGFQNASDGNAYCGIVTYVKGDNSNYHWYREALGVQLISDLVIGQKYYLSFKASFTLNGFETDCASNKLGAWFTNSLFNSSDSLTSAPISNLAQIYSDSIITDTVNWTTITGSFVADSTYRYMAIGNFFKNNIVDTVDYNNGLYASYYYIDDVRLSTDSAFTVSNNQIENTINSVLIYPNPSDGLVKFVLPQNANKTTVSVYNVYGQEVYTSYINAKESVDLSFLDNGIYSIILTNNSKQYSTKLLIHK